MNLLINNAVLVATMPRDVVCRPTATDSHVVSFNGFAPWWATNPASTATRHFTRN